MTSRERVQAALAHRQPDKVPVDFGSTPVTGISASLIFKLRRALGLAEKPVKVIDCYQMLGEIDEELRDYLGTDCLELPGYAGMYGFRNEGWKPWTLFDGTPVLVPQAFNTKAAPDGTIYQYPGGDATVPPSARMPAGGFYFDAIERQPPLDEDNLDVRDNLEEFTRLSDAQLAHYQRQAARLRGMGNYAVTAAPGGTALGDIALVPGMQLKHPKGIRAVEEWYVSMAIRQDYLMELFDRQTEIALENLRLFHQAVGDKIDVINLCGTDFGTQNAPICSTELFDTVYLPFYKRMTDWIHRSTGWKVFKHSCGAVRPLIPSLIAAGFDILNPVQNSASGMDAAELKAEFGDRLVFWGGGVDTQHTLPTGTPQQVYDQVTQRIKTYNQNGGFVFNTIHNTQATVPVENFMAMVDAIKQFR